MGAILNKNKIPVVAIASLALGGACRGDGSGAGGGNLSYAQQLCANMSDCEPQYFSLYYDSMSACVDVLEEEIRQRMEEMEELHSAACADAYYVAMACYAEAYANCELDHDLISRCETLYYDVFAVCDF